MGRLSTSVAVRTCRAPASSKFFKLLSGAGAYWREVIRHRARCCSASTAPRSSRRTTSPSTPDPHWKRRRSATIASSASTSTCSCSVHLLCARRHLLDRAWHGDDCNELNALLARVAARRLPGDSGPRCSTTRRSGKSSGHYRGKYKGEHVPGARQRDRRARFLAQAGRELGPSHYLDAYQAKKQHSYKETCRSAHTPPGHDVLQTATRCRARSPGWTCGVAAVPAG